MNFHKGEIFRTYFLTSSSFVFLFYYITFFRVCNRIFGKRDNHAIATRTSQIRAKDRCSTACEDCRRCNVLQTGREGKKLRHATSPPVMEAIIPAQRDDYIATRLAREHAYAQLNACKIPKLLVADINFHTVTRQPERRRKRQLNFLAANANVMNRFTALNRSPALDTCHVS